ncbi:Adapter molecule Crk [Clonorchis sinensis]|uniref:Adapter molecule Crk n=1 Tax=Clonorchis sinensis TaxID=79923 RepID=A0A3R7G4G1_CLOSI|nr:Adapter molecule Crk [Clonorchis sinensis]
MSRCPHQIRAMLRRYPWSSIVRSAVAPFRCITEGSANVDVLPGCPGLEPGSREAEVRFEPQTYRSMVSDPIRAISSTYSISVCECPGRISTPQALQAASESPMVMFGKPDTIPALVLPSGGMAVRHRLGDTAELNGGMWSGRLGTRSPFVWYFGELSREKTNELLLDQPVGTFLVRDSTTHSGFVLTVKESDGVKRFLIPFMPMSQKFRFGESLYDSLDDLIRYYMNSKSAMRLTQPAPKDVYLGLYNFQAKDDTEVSFSRAERLYFIRQKGQWMLCKAESSGQIGWVPVNYVQEFSPELHARLSGQNDQACVVSDCRKGKFLSLPKTGKVIRARNPSAFLEGHLKIQVGELLQVYKVLQDGFCEVWREDQVSGLVPINYLELLDD